MVTAVNEYTMFDCGPSFKLGFFYDFFFLHLEFVQAKQLFSSSFHILYLFYTVLYPFLLLYLRLLMCSTKESVYYNHFVARGLRHRYFVRYFLSLFLNLLRRNVKKKYHSITKFCIEIFCLLLSCKIRCRVWSKDLY